MKRLSKMKLWYILLFIISTVYCTENVNLRSNSKEVQNLRTFTKVFGYVKYFHPSDEASKIDWDIFAIYGSEKVKIANSSHELEEILKEIFLPIAPTIQIFNSESKPKTNVRRKLSNDYKVVTWQHKGVWLGSKEIYRSIRTNRENKLDRRSSQSGTITQSLDAKKYYGKTIKLQAWIKTDLKGIGNTGHLWLKSHKGDNQISFFDAMHDKPITTNSWKNFELMGIVSNNDETISFGCFLKGNGILLVDDFKLSYFEDNKWIPIPIINPNFEKDSRQNIIGWASDNSSFFNYGLDSSKRFTGKKSLRIENTGTTFSGKLFDKTTKIGESIFEEIGSGLSCIIPLALYSDSNATIGANNSSSFNVLLDSLDKTRSNKLTLDSEKVRLGNIITMWNVLQHFYPYFEIVGTNWDFELTNTLKEFLQPNNKNEYINILQRLVSKLHDGHGKVFVKRDREGSFPFNVEWIENNIVITSIIDSTKFKVGDIIQSINDISAKEILFKQEELLSGSSQWKKVRALERFGYGKFDSKVKLRIERKGKNININTIREEQKYIAQSNRKNIYEIEKEIFYVNLDHVIYSQIEKRIDELTNAKGVIFDLRGYPNGSITELLCHMLNEPDTSMSWMQIPRIIYPDGKNISGYTKYNWELKSKEPQFQGKLVFLTNAKAISYSESILGYVENYKLAEIVGEPTAGANGNINIIDLVGGIRVIFTGMKVTKHNGKQHHLIGIRPTFPVVKTIKGVLEDRDEFIEKAIEIINKNISLN